MEEKVYKIVIDAPDGLAEDLDKDKQKTKKSKKDMVTAGIALATIKKAIDFSKSSIEMYTGNSVAQRQLNEALTMGAWAIGFATSPIMTSAMLAINTAVNVATATNEQKWENRRTEQMARRSGNYLSTTTR